MWWSNFIGVERLRKRRSWLLDTASPVLANILHALLVPLSFLVLARLLTAQSHFQDFHVGSGENDGFFPFFLNLCFNSIILYLLLSLLVVAAFLHTLTGGRFFLIHLLFCRRNDSHESRLHRLLLPRGLQLCCSLALAELTIEFHQTPLPSLSGYHRRSSRSGGWLFAVGLYETMILWLESVVKVVTEDEAMTVLLDGEMIKKRRRRMVIAERMALGLSFGALWWWRLRDQVDYFLLAAEKDDHSVLVLEMAIFAGLGLYYLTVVTGAIRCFAGVTGMTKLVIRGCPIRRSKITPPPWMAEETV